MYAMDQATLSARDRPKRATLKSVRRGAITAALAAAAVSLGPAATAHAGYDPGPAGANDFSCKPTPAQPRPVVLVHGLSANATYNWGYMAPVLYDAGFCVFALTYGVDPRTEAFPYSPGGTIPMEQSAPQLKAFIDRVLAATGASQVDLFGHSEGTVMPRYYLERLGGASKVKRWVALTPLWRGTELAGANLFRDSAKPYGLDKPFIDLFASFCGSCPQLVAGSDYLNDLNADGEAIPGIEHTNIPTKYDELVQPWQSGLMRDGGMNIPLQDVCPANISEHLMVVFDPAVAQLALNALAPEYKLPVRCDLGYWQRPPGAPEGGRAAARARPGPAQAAAKRPGRARLASKRAANVSRRSYSVALRCPAEGGACAGKVTATSTKALSVGKKKRRLALGSAKYDIAAGKTTWLKLKLPKQAAKLLAAERKLAAKVVASPASSSAGRAISGTVTLRTGR